VIKNKRGEFLTTLTKQDLEKHRKTAKTDYIWKQRYAEMCMKTIMKKACKLHFGDVFTGIEEQDNENYSLDNPLELEMEYKSDIDAIETIEELKEYYNTNK
jgi:recombinational DNA repair protein RecT